MPLVFPSVSGLPYLMTCNPADVGEAAAPVVRDAGHVSRYVEAAMETFFAREDWTSAAQQNPLSMLSSRRNEFALVVVASGCSKDGGVSQNKQNARTATSGVSEHHYTSWPLSPPICFIWAPQLAAHPHLIPQFSHHFHASNFESHCLLMNLKPKFLLDGLETSILPRLRKYFVI
jgi:hypothetical protein